MEKQKIINAAIQLIHNIAKEKNLEITDLGLGHGNDGTFWEKLPDKSGIPTVTAKGIGYSIKLRPFWDSPEIDIRRGTDNGEELLVITYSDKVKNNETGEYESTGNFKLDQIRVDGTHGNYRECITDVYWVAYELERLAMQ